jgi:hypothetical protein
MTWIEQNLDAYRVIAEILNDLRPLVRQRLEFRFGKDWFKDGIPEETFDRLIRDKEREIAIDWYENRYQEVLNYAVFPDLFEIVTANAELFQPILNLAPSQSLLHTRFLELEVMRAKIGRAREISEAEITFLTTFHLRFRKSVQELSAGTNATEDPVEVDEPTEDREPAADHAAVDSPDSVEQAEESPSEADQTDEVDVEIEEPGASDGGATEEEPTEFTPPTPKKDRPPLRLAQPTASAEPNDPETETEETEPESEEEEKLAPFDEDTAVRETASAYVQRAMEANDSQAVLRRLYREVTGIAEGIWTTEAHPSTAVWDKVSTHTWYEENFSKLELRPLSDFYEIISQVRSRRQSGDAKPEIQSFLNESNFATVLLALRDMFQKNQI